MQQQQSQAARDIYSELGYATDFEDRFTLGQELGSGSFGTVYSAIDKDSGAKVAVKVLPAPSSARPGRVSMASLFFVCGDCSSTRS